MKIIAHDHSLHARILAGPGTGKSISVVEFIHGLMMSNPDLSIRLITFTRAATAELSRKVETQAASAVRPSTVHSFSMSVLSQNRGIGGIVYPIRLVDDWEYKNVVQPSLARRASLTKSEVEKFRQEMSANWESLEEKLNPKLDDSQRARFRGAREEHQHVMGYTLLSELPYSLLKGLESHPHVSGLELDVLVIDEYQDLNACDLRLLKEISEHSGCTILAVGDDDQSIYSFRHAAPAGIRRFTTDYAGAKDYELTVTQRCGKQIIEWSNYVISADPDRPPTRSLLVPSSESANGEVALFSFGSEKREASGISKLVEHLINIGVPAREILVLFRTDYRGAISKPIREALGVKGIPVTDPSVVDSMLENEGVRWLIGILRLGSNRHDSIAWASLLHLTEKIGPRFHDDLYELAKHRGISFADCLIEQHEAGFPDVHRSSSTANRQVSEIMTLLDHFDRKCSEPSQHPGDLVRSFYEERLTHVIAIPEEFWRLLMVVDQLTEQSAPLDRYLGQIGPLARDAFQSRSEGVRLMTMAASKGLTVQATTICGLEDELFPRQHSDISEERRLLYVAMTRSREYLFGTWVRTRFGPSKHTGKASQYPRNLCRFLRDGPVKTKDGDKVLDNYILRSTG